MGLGLLFIGGSLLVGGWLIVLISLEGKLRKRPMLRVVFALTSILLGWMVFSLGVQQEIRQECLDGGNPYRKEYVYQQNTSGDFVIIDSTYTKK